MFCTQPTFIIITLMVSNSFLSDMAPNATGMHKLDHERIMVRDSLLIDAHYYASFYNRNWQMLLFKLLKIA